LIIIMKRKHAVILISIFIILPCLGTYIYLDIPLRTAIFRSLAKGNWYIVPEADTLFAMGYYGVRKYTLTPPNTLELIAENSDFCTNTNIARGGALYKECLYVSTRSYLGGEKQKKSGGYINGALLVLDRKDLKEIKRIDSDIKLVEAKTYGRNLIVSGLRGFDIYDIADPKAPRKIFQYRHPSWKEYQGFDFFDADQHTYIVFALFTGGIEIWDMTNPTKAELKAAVPVSIPMETGDTLSEGGSVLHVLSDYPYVYAPLAPSRKAFGNGSGRRGILTYEIGDLDNIKVNCTLIPDTDWYSKSTGDLAPSFIDKYRRTVYTNFGEKGVALFDITRPFEPRYVRTLDVTGCNALIQPICITSEGELYSGSYYWSDIYIYELSSPYTLQRCEK